MLAGRTKNIASVPISIGSTELKRFTHPLITNFSSISSSGTSLDLLALITAGLSYFQRVGRVITVYRITYRGVMHGAQSNSIADDPYNEVRMCLLEANSGATINSSVLSLNLPPDRRTFPGLVRVGRDRRIVLRVSARDSTGYIPSVTEVQGSLTLGKNFCYSGDGVSPLTSTTLFLYCISDSTLIVHPGFVTGYITIEFTDM